MIPRPPRSTRTDTLFPYTTLFRSTGLRRVRVAKKFEPQAPAPLVKIKVAPIGPVGRWRQYPSTLNRPKEKSAEGGESHQLRSEEHTSELQSLMRISYAVFGLKKKNTKRHPEHTTLT